MTLISSGTLYLGPITDIVNDNIRKEILGSTGSYNLSTALTAKGSGTIGTMSEFYGYSHITTVPNAPTIGTPVWASIISIYQSSWTNNNTGGLVQRTYVETNRDGAGWIVEGYVTDTQEFMDNSMLCGAVTATTRVRHWNIIGYSTYSAISSAISIACD